MTAERAMLAEQPDLTFADFDAAMPAGWDGELPGSVGPRHLEAAAARTCQVLVEATATRAYADLVLSGRYGYAALASQLERVLEDERPAGTGLLAGSLRGAQAAAAAYSAAVVRPPRWAYSAVDRIAPGIVQRLERERVRWYRRGPWRRRP